MKQMGQVIKVKKATITKPKKVSTPRRIEKMRPEPEPRPKWRFYEFLDDEHLSYILEEAKFEFSLKAPPSIFDRWRR